MRSREVVIQTATFCGVEGTIFSAGIAWKRAFVLHEAFLKILE
jgi:hypothetical protein